jgi:hypothetical protein
MTHRVPFRPLTRFSEWLPFAARLLGAPEPGHIDEASARKRLGDMRVYYMNEQRGASNAKVKRDFGLELDFPSWNPGSRHSTRTRLPDCTGHARLSVMGEL